ncbi:helix-turn-helix transcriptional regulator [Actinopolymorpha alba]|uniref:helix-turn-helix transcriptional regulator n=1 Tax=Actinopolymorpha alba TaxID=533267 RepID=UPI00037D9A67|nr:AraC family transcriptional regulator [Actinopolymorpha alba]
MTCRLRVPVGAEVAHYPPGATYGPRTLVDFEFVWLLHGSAWWDCGDTRFRLRPGTLLLARPGMRDHFVWDSERGSSHAYVHFHLADAGDLGAPDSWPLTRPIGPSDSATSVAPLAALCGYALWLGSSRSPAMLDRTADVVAWLLDLFVRGPMPTTDAAEALPSHLTRLAAQIRRAWRDGGIRPLTLAELAAAAGVSPGHLSRMFRKEYAIGPVAAIELIRLVRAATLLQRSNLTVGAVAAACGFANPFHFSRRFRVVYGVPPRTYRTSHNAEDPHQPLSRSGLLVLAHHLGRVE